MKDRWIIAVLTLAVLLPHASLHGEGMTGKQAPEIKAIQWKNSPGVSLKSLQGKIVVIAFYVTWLPLCQEVAPQIANLCNKYKDREVHFIGLTSETKVSDVVKFVRKYDFQFPVGIGSISSADYMVSGLPSVFIVGPSGKIIWEGSGPLISELENRLKQITQDPAVLGGQENTEIGEELISEESAPPSKKDVITFLKECRKKARKLAGDEVAAIECFEKVKSMIGPFMDDKAVSRAALRFLGGFVGRSTDAIKHEAVEMIGAFENNDLAAGILISGIKLLASRGLTEKTDLLFVMIQNLFKCGKYNSRAASALYSVFSSKAGKELEVKKMVLQALGKIRTVTSLDILSQIMPKICPNMAHPNYYYYSGRSGKPIGDQNKRKIWIGLRGVYCYAIYELTGEKQGFDGNPYWSYSDLKSYLNQNKKILQNRFIREKLRESKK